ncbi:MAG: ABC transporter substrate-binding protein [Clostridia bacterium]|nr:ABC transporter substrate-binding protein [Clostridia bacterium]
MKKFAALVLAVLMMISLLNVSLAEEQKTYKIGLCNLVDDASLNQIVDNLQAQLSVIEAERGVTIEVMYDNCNMNFGDLSLIIDKYIANSVDLMVGVTTPVASAMKGKTETNGIPVVFAAVSDPEGSGLVDSNAKPGANVTGTSDFLDTSAVFNLIFAANPDIKNVALLYNPSEDASTTPITDAKAILESKGVAYQEFTGTDTSQVILAAASIIANKAEAVFTPTDNTIMTAELAIYEDLAAAGIPHYTGADSFALNGAFLGYGVDYANLGKETANMVASILLDGADPAETQVMTFDNGTATVNTETCEILGLNYEEVAALFAPYCIEVKPITTAENFGDLNN